MEGKKRTMKIVGWRGGTSVDDNDRDGGSWNGNKNRSTSFVNPKHVVNKHI